MGLINPPLDLQTEFADKGLLVSWFLPTGYTEIKLRVDKCEPERDCQQFLRLESFPGDSYLLVDRTAAPCTIYNIHIEAQPDKWHLQPLRDEISSRTWLFSGCQLSDQLILSAIILLPCLLLLSISFLLYFWLRRNRLINITRFRSRLYSRLYSQDRYHNPVKKDELQEFMAVQLKDPQPFNQEFSRLEKLAFDTIQRLVSQAEGPDNRKRNRYRDIVPYDWNRVPVPPYKTKGDSELSDYINASFVSDINTGSPRKYIAAQGPAEDTIAGFWSMIWHYDVKVVLMLTNLVEGCGLSSIKCSKYWPDTLGSVKRFGEIEVQLFDEAEAPHYTVRKLDVGHKRLGGDSRVITHIQFTNWLDRSTPSNQEPSELLQLVHLTRVMCSQGRDNIRVKQDIEATSSPLLVHCSAGVGRTGTFIAVDQIIRALDSRQSTDIDIFHITYLLRKERMFMVQTRAQYEYIYRCVQAYIESKQNKLSVSSTSSQPVSPV